MNSITMIAVLLLCTMANHLSFAFVAYSPDIHSKKEISQDYCFNDFTCTGKNMSPKIVWNDVPKNTASFAVTVYDIDAPTQSGWWHWLVVNIPSNVLELPEGAGGKNDILINNTMIQVKNDFGFRKYGGPCPPKGDKAHRYIFTVYALDIDKLPLPEDASAAYASFLIGQHTIKKSAFTGLSSRSNK